MDTEYKEEVERAELIDNARDTEKRIGSFEKYLLLCWKNYKLQRRRIVKTIIEILVPLIVAALVIMIRHSINPREEDEPVVFQAFKVDTFPNTFGTIIHYPQVAVTR